MLRRRVILTPIDVDIRVFHDGASPCAPSCTPFTPHETDAAPLCRVTDQMSVCAGHRSASRRCIACQYRSVWAVRCALRCAPMAARSLRHLTDDATLARNAAQRASELPHLVAGGDLGSFAQHDAGRAVFVVAQRDGAL